MSFLIRLLVKIRDLRERIQRLDPDKASDHALLLQGTNHTLEREWTVMCLYWYRPVQEVKDRSLQGWKLELVFFLNVQESLKYMAQKLHDENTRLRTEIRAAQDAQEEAERRADANAPGHDDLIRLSNAREE
ncbi:hypothetical protein PHMEG_00020050 [Phytophthora megakarya]|uniref:Uncharacterized protein n=1 Tax=Phytophthora megakarya TaxID=4795 RepID=A0A225VR10_9STRA|nr:hypothetical protein PHMEG_00020050 [Phytophthora megakarya]